MKLLMTGLIYISKEHVEGCPEDVHLVCRRL